MTDEPLNVEEQEDGAPVCEKCGNLLIKESLSSSDLSEQIEKSDGEWCCPHCQGEIDFLGDEDDE